MYNIDMAQVLKDNLRQAIIQAAKQEFLLSGFEKASMRNIANMANMTVGNLYRYFDSKQDIKNYILTGTMNELKNIFNSVNSYNIKMEARVFNIKANSNELKEMMNSLAQALVDLYINSNMEFKILMNDDQMIKTITKWFSDAISTLINQHYVIAGYGKEKEILLSSYSNAIFSGLKQIFDMAEGKDPDRLLEIVKIYLNSYINMLDMDIREK